MFKILIVSFVTLMFVITNISPSETANKLVKIDGSSTVFPITEGIAEEFQKANRDVKVTVGISGTGGGFKKFCRGEIDISNASRPIAKKEIESCKDAGIEFIELPIAYDGIAVIVNPKNTWVTSMTLAELKIMWEPAAAGKIKKWNQIKSEWPDAPIKLFAPGVDSGTFDYFTEAIMGKSKSSRSDYSASEDDNVLVQGIASDKNAIGYFGYAYYAENAKKLKVIAIDGGKGPVLPSEKTIMDGTYQPLSRPVLIYIAKKSVDKPEVKEFVNFYLKNASKIATQVKYIPLPAKAYKLAEERFVKGKTGTVFEGEARVGVKVEDLLKLEEKKK